MTTVKPANAGAITRSLVAAGFTRGEEHKASRGVVRGGWSTFTEGVVSETVMKHGRQRVRQGSYRDGSPRYGFVSNNTPTGFVTVGYQFSRSGDRLTQDERNAKATSVLTRAAEHLRTKGFEVEMKTNEGTLALPYLSVCRRNAAGEVVVF